MLAEQVLFLTQLNSTLKNGHRHKAPLRVFRIVCL